MEPELSALFQVKVVNKNIVPCSLGAQHQASFAVWCLFLEKQNFLNQTVTLKCISLLNSTLVSFMWREYHFV